MTRHCLIIVHYSCGCSSVRCALLKNVGSDRHLGIAKDCRWHADTKFLDAQDLEYRQQTHSIIAVVDS